MNTYTDEDEPIVGSFVGNDEQTLQAWETLSSVYKWPHSSYNPEALQAFAKALAEFQGQCPQITKGKTARAGSYSYNYADLGDILHTVRPALAANGLALIQTLGNADDGRPTVTSILLHESGHSERSTFAFAAGADMQKLGSAVTYARRYSACAILGVVAEDDDDGAYASQSSPTRAAQAAKVAANGSGDAITEKQLGMLGMLCDKVSLEAEERVQLLRGLYGVETRKDLTKSQASGLIESLTALVDEGPDSPRWDKVNAAIGRGSL